jgi:CheY-like chemotaxis protein
MNIVLFSSDLILASSAQRLVEGAGGALAIAADAPAAIAACDAQDDRQAIVVDLRTPGLDLPALVAEARRRAPGATIHAFGPHVHADLLAAARAAGCDAVFTRGEYERRLAALVAELTT